MDDVMPMDPPEMNNFFRRCILCILSLLSEAESVLPNLATALSSATFAKFL